MTEEKPNTMEDDLFAQDNFVHYKEICVKNNKNPKVVTKYKFGLREISGFQEDQIAKKAIKLNAKTGSAEIDQAEANQEYLTKVLVEAPFTINIENVRKLSSKIKKELLDFAREINTVSSDVEKK